MPELIRTRCNVGHLVVTENIVRVETKLMGQKTRNILRQNITGVDIMPYPKLFGIGGKHADLTFNMQGAETVQARAVKIADAKKVMELLGYS